MTTTIEMRARRLSRSPWIGDVVVALVAYGLTLAVMSSVHDGRRGLDPLGVVLAAVACFPLVAHRRWPLGVFVLTTAASATLNGLGYALGPPFGPTIALFYVALDPRTRSRLGRTAAVVLGMYAIHVGATVIPSHHVPTTAILAGIAVWGGAWIVGDQVRQRRQRLADLAESAHRTEREAERERRLAAAEERTRIARDLHDSAAHAINVILVQAGAARLLQHRDPDAVRTALGTIEDVARETVGEIDQLVRALREDGDNGWRGATDHPIGLAALDTLLERHRVAGLRVELETRGRPRPLAPALDQAAYRILQESLTNSARHGTGRASVEISYGEDALALDVSNGLPPGGGEPLGSGHGILGMRERAALLGGSLRAGVNGGTFSVSVRLPYPDGEPR